MVDDDVFRPERVHTRLVKAREFDAGKAKGTQLTMRIDHDVKDRLQQRALQEDRSIALRGRAAIAREGLDRLDAEEPKKARPPKEQRPGKLSAGSASAKPYSLTLPRACIRAAVARPMWFGGRDGSLNDDACG